MRNAAITSFCVVVCFKLTLSTPALSAEAPKQPANDTAPTLTAPTTTAPATDPSVNPGTEAFLAARVFLRAIAKQDDNAAYNLTSPAFREANTPEQFAQRMATMREAAKLSGVPPLSGWVLLKPQDGEPRRAMLANSAVPIPRNPGPRIGRQPRPNAVGIELIEHEGRWLVADARELVPGQGGDARQFAPGREAHDFTAPIRKLGTRNGTARPISTGIRGVIAEIKDGSLTLRLTPSGVAPADDAPQLTFKLDENSSVAVGVPTTQRKLLNGKSVWNMRFTFGTPADLKPGNEVTIELGDEDDYAAEVRMILAPDSGGPGL